MAKTYNGRFDLPKEPEKGTFWMVLGVILIVFGNVPGLVLGIMSLTKYGKYKKERRIYERFLEYCAIVGMRGSVSFRELGKAGGRSKNDVQRDLQAMIAKGYFGEGAYLDVDGGRIMLPDGGEEGQVRNWKDAALELMHTIQKDLGMFKDACSSQNTAEETEPEYEQKCEPSKQHETASESQNAANQSNVKRTYLDELERILQELYQLNEQIEDQGVSERIDRIGELTGGIFRAVIENPSLENDVRKFMNYYLPTTLKLLKSYDMMENQSYQGENILASRKKIENVLDMLIEAYEKQLDRLFRNDALDIATDIDVLETMMAGDGLSSKGQMQF